MTSDYLQAYADSGLYIMQGRLSPPEDGRFQSFPRKAWESEIEIVPALSLRGIEWIYDRYGEGFNPLETAEGRAFLRAKLVDKGVRVVSICADYFMDYPLAQGDAAARAESRRRLEWLISVCPEMGVGRIVLPFVDASRIEGGAARKAVIDVLRRVLPLARTAGVELHLETDFGPAAFRAFLNDIDDPLVKVNYDAGNSSALGYRPAEEFAAYGDRVGSFHVKDRVYGGKSVPLGQGDADFATLRDCLIKVGYSGDFVLQVARGETGDESSWLATTHELACKWLRGEALLKSGC